VLAKGRVLIISFSVAANDRSRTEYYKKLAGVLASGCEYPYIPGVERLGDVRERTRRKGRVGYSAENMQAEEKG
jgi:hypothetical protein